MKLVYDSNKEVKTITKKTELSNKEVIVQFLKTHIKEIEDLPDEVELEKALLVYTLQDSEHDGYNFAYAGYKTNIFDILYIFERIKNQYLTGQIDET